MWIIQLMPRKLKFRPALNIDRHHDKDQYGLPYWVLYICEACSICCAKFLHLTSIYFYFPGFCCDRKACNKESQYELHYFGSNQT